MNKTFKIIGGIYPAPKPLGCRMLAQRQSHCTTTQHIFARPFIVKLTPFKFAYVINNHYLSI